MTHVFDPQLLLDRGLTLDQANMFNVMATFALDPGEHTVALVTHGLIQASAGGGYELTPFGEEVDLKCVKSVLHAKRPARRIPRADEELE